jgi:hypothetical protein
MSEQQTEAEQIAAFVTARLDEAAAAAEAAFSSQADPENGWGLIDNKALYASGGYTITPHVGHAHEQVQAEHIVAWHPGRVLADVAVKRDIVASCLAIDVQILDANLWGMDEHLAILASLASAWRDHPDYAPAWED